MIRNILFDLDNTLFDFDKAEALAVRRTLLELGVDPSPAVVTRYSQLNLAQWKLLELGQLTRQEVKLRRYQLLFEELGIRQDPGKAARIYETQLGIGHYFIGTTASIWSPTAQPPYRKAGCKAPGSSLTFRGSLSQKIWAQTSQAPPTLTPALPVSRIFKKKRP